MTPTPRRILITTESFNPAVDAGTAATRHLVDELLSRGNEVMVLAPAPGLASYKGAEVVRIAVHERPGRQVKQALVDFAPDLVHVQSPGTVGRKALKHARKQQIPTVTVQTTPVSDLVAPVWHSRVAERSDVLLTTSRWLVPELGRVGAQAEVWYPGTDTDTFSPARRDETLHEHWSRTRKQDTPLAPDLPMTVVGYAGRLDHAHAIGRLVDLVGLPGVRLVVIGDGPHKAWLQKRLPGAKFTGHLDSADLGRAVASLDILVHPGEHESCCHPLREAAASGVPVIAPRAGGAIEVVRHQESGLLFEPGDYRSFKQAVSNLAADQERAALGRDGRALAEERTWSDAVDELIEQHYASVLTSRAIEHAG